MDPVFVVDGRATPFASITAYEAGVTVEQTFLQDLRLVFASALFETKVDQDLIFDQTAGRNTLAGATTRRGSANALRVSGPSFDVSINGTYVRATFDDTQLLVLRPRDVAEAQASRIQIDALLFQLRQLAIP